MWCPTCRQETADGLEFCSGCGAEHTVDCSRCGATNRRSANYCGRCAAPLGAVVRATFSVGERRQITVLFCDLVNSTGMSESLDPEDWRDVLRTYQGKCGDIVRQLGGHVAQYLGDGLLIYFGYPIAHEDSPKRAVQAGLGMLQAMARLDSRLALRIRVGIHTGPVVIDEMGHDKQREFLAVGETPNLAARVQGAAEPDSILVSEATYRITVGYFDFTPMGALPLKGFSTPISLYRVDRETGVRSRLDVAAARGLTPFSDRGKELAWVLERWRDALDGKGPMVLFGGEAGIGKSRLVWVLRERLAAEPSLALECTCSPSFRGSALHPVREMIERHLGFTPDVDTTGRLANLRAEVDRLRLGPEALPLLASFLSLTTGDDLAAAGLSPARQRQATFDTLIAWLYAMAVEQPVLLVVEDVHWADPSTLQLLSLLVERAPASPLLTILTHRPEFVCPWSSPRVAALHLPRIPPAEARQILDAVTRGRSLPRESVQEVLTKADGVPLFLEEIAKAVLDTGSMRPEAGAGLDLAPSSTVLPIPATVRDSLTARLDRLGTGKAIVQLASMLGRTFSFDVLQAVSDLDEKPLRMELDRLEASELLFRGGTPPHHTYTFKHALIQDTAYASVLRSARSQYHRRIAKVLTERFPDVADAQPELLAQHFARAGMVDEAIAKWLAAGQRAIARSAYLEARSSLQNALEQLESMPPSRDRDRLELELRLSLGVALVSTYGYSAKEVEDNYVRAGGLCERIGDTPPEVLDGVWAVHLVRSDREETARLAMLFAALIAKSEDVEAKRMAYAALGVRAFYSADYAQALELFRRALLLPEPSHIDATSPVQSYLYALLYSGMCHAVVGHDQEAQTKISRALAFAQKAENPYSVAMALSFSAWFAHDRGDVEATADFARQQLDIAVKCEFPFWVGLALTHLGWADARAGRVNEGIGQIESGSTMLHYMGAFVVSPYPKACLIEAYLLAGRLDDALATVDEALAFSEGKLAQNYVPMLIAYKGGILASRGDRVAGEEHYRRSIATLHGQGATMMELKVSLALARLLRESGRGSEARSLLETAGALFGDAEFPELKTARSLLAEL
jgi:class 3 adenylate cyclase/tetratricopeptide (TPR) repeat protein